MHLALLQFQLALRGLLKCTFEASKVAVGITGFTSISKSAEGESKMVTQIQQSPMSVCVDAQKWQTYKKGIIGAKCGNKLDHCVQAVGLTIAANRADDDEAGSGNYW